MCLLLLRGRFKNDKEKISPSTNKMIERGLKIKPEIYISDLNSQRRISEVFNQKFLNFDAVISISTCTIAPLLNVEETIDQSLILDSSWTTYY